MSNSRFSVQEWRFNSLFVAFLLFGVQLVSFAPTILNISAQIFLWVANIVVFLWSIVIIFRSFKQKSLRFKPNFALILFLILYSFRMYHDLFISKIYTNTFPNPYTYFIYFFGICLLPSFAINQIRNIDFYYTLQVAYKILFLILILALGLNLSGGMASESTGIELRSSGNDSMGSLTFGHLGVSFAIISIFRFRKERKTYYLLLALLGVVSMIISGSRSPLLALLVVVFLMFQGSKGIVKPILVLSLVALPIILFWEKLISFLGSLNVGIVYRTLEAIQENKSSGRDILYEQVINQIKNSPFFGDSFLVTEGPMIGFYPHNLVLESLLVTGIFGTFFLFIWLMNVFKKAYKLIKVEHLNSWVAFLFIQFFIYGMFSKSFYTNQYFWYYAFLILCFYDLFYKKVKT